MRLMRPVVVAAALLSAVVLTAPSDAAPVYKAKSLSITDASGDGNAINDQGLGVTDSSAPAAGVDGYDIIKLDYLGTGKMIKKGRVYLPNCTGFTVKLTFKGAIGPQAIIRVTGVGTVNDARWWLQYDGTKTTIRYGHTSSDVTGSTDVTATLTTPAKVDGATLTFTVLEADVKATDEKLQKLTLSAVGASVRTTTGVVTAPQWDAIPEGSASFKAC